MSRNFNLFNNAAKLPEGWRQVRLGEVCQINPRRPLNLIRNDDVLTSFVPMVAVDEQLGTIANPEEKPFKDISKGYTFFAENDVLFAKITPCMQNGKHAIARNLINGIGFGSTEFHVLRPTDQTIPEWIHFYIRQPMVLRNAVSHFTGAVGQQRVPEYFLVNLSIPLPPLPEQKRIATILNEDMEEVEKARTAAEAQLGATKALFAAYLRKVFKYKTGNKLPEGWRWERLENVCRVVSGSTPATGIVDLWNGDICWITPTDLGKLLENKIYSSSRYISKIGYDSCGTELVPPGSVVISSRAPIGHLGIAKVPLCTNQGCKSFIPTESIDSDYLYFALKNSVPILQSLGSGATFTEISKSQLASFKIPLPPLLEQKSIAAFLNEQMAEAEKLNESVAGQLHTIKSLPASLLRQAFSGEL